jgi:hypothetical protein
VVPATRSLLALAAAAILLGCGFLGSCSGKASHSAGGGGCSPAQVGGKPTCLQTGQRCKPGHERVYRSYGLTCKPGDGGYRLRERTFIGPANP